ncbi:unnamed protein product, partial [Echinostoma caproni]|uniref:Reverse transcriptase domain-containing protein n=1 Tax=Echinostoma caproni TaxID=27848 RepID=A0A183A379_9TREM
MGSGKAGQPGQQVFLHTPILPPGQPKKLHKTWSGPFNVLEILSDNNFRIVPTNDRNTRPATVHFNPVKSTTKATGDLNDKSKQQGRVSDAAVQVEVPIEDQVPFVNYKYGDGDGIPKYASDTSFDDKKPQNNEMISPDIRTKLPHFTTLPPSSYQQYEPPPMFEADMNLTLWKAKIKRHLSGVPPEYQSSRILDRLSDCVQKLVLQQHVDEEYPPRKIWETLD